MDDSESVVNRTTDTIAGIATLVVAVSISFAAVLIGESSIYGQVTNSLIGANLWFVAAAGALVVTIIGALLTLFIALEVISVIGDPDLFGRTEYTILGIGGFIGIGAAVLTSLGTTVTNTSILTESVPAGTGESTLALAAIAIPFAAVYYKLYTPSMTPLTVGDDQTDKMEPEVVKQRTEKWSDEAAVNPAFPPGQDPNPNTGNRKNTPPSSPEDGHPSNNGRGDGQQDTESNVDTSEWEFNWQTETGTDFDDIGGMGDLKDELRSEVIKPLENPEKAEKLGVSAPNIVFHGPPGTGKTYTAEALATELGLPFASLSGADVQSKWINESATKVNSLFNEAEEMAAREGGAVVFLDELDSVLKNRSGGGSAHEEDNKVVNEFLNHLEGTKEHNVVFVGATNRLDALDDAGIRSGRIDLKIHVGKPDAEAREAILRAQLDDREHDVPEKGIAELAAATNGAVAADLELLVNRAAKNVLSRDGDVIQWSDVEAAVDTID